jgi:2-keto-4-pentenoate hydratase
MAADAERELALLLAQLRREGRCQSGLAERLVPPDHDAAYRVAGQVADLLGWRRAGWKIAANGAAMQQALRTTSPIHGRVFAPFLHASPTSLAHASLVHPIAECEYVATLGTDLPPRPHSYGEDEVRAAVAAIAPGIEVAECRFIHDEAFPPLAAILADGSGSGHLVLGQPIPDWPRRDIAGQPVILRVDGQERRRGTARDALRILSSH